MELSTLTCVAFAGVVGLVTVLPASKRKKVVDVTWLLFVSLPLYVLLALERRFPHIVRLSFPRNTKEIIERPQAFFSLLSTSRAGGVAQEVRILRTHEAEPDKDQTSAMLTVVYSDDQGKEREVDVFAKFTGERPWPLLIKVVGAAFLPYHPEVNFHSLLANRIPMASPPFLGSAHSRLFQKAVVVTQMVTGDYRTIPDHQGVDYTTIECMLREVAGMHALYWDDDVRRAPETRWLAQRGVHGIDTINLDLFLNKPDLEPYWVPLWRALGKYFVDAHVSLQHGDFRPGNMLFLPRLCRCARRSSRHAKRDSTPDRKMAHPVCDDYNNESHGEWQRPDMWHVNSGKPGHRPDHPSAEAPCIIFADWEAIAVLPFMWDFMYLCVLAQSPEERLLRHKGLLGVYREALLSHGVPPEQVTVEECERQRILLQIVLVYYSWMLQQVGAVGETQGNTLDDGRAWSRRVAKAVIDDVDAEQCAEWLQCDPQHLRDLRTAVIRDAMWSLKPGDVPEQP